MGLRDRIEAWLNRVLASNAGPTLRHYCRGCGVQVKHRGFCRECVKPTHGVK